MKKIFVLLSFTVLAFILIVNTGPAAVEIFTGITVANSEPLTLLLFGSVLIGLANVGRKKVIKKENGIEHSGMPPKADSLEENDRLVGWFAGKQVSEGPGNK